MTNLTVIQASLDAEQGAARARRRPSVIARIGSMGQNRIGALLLQQAQDERPLTWRRTTELGRSANSLRHRLSSRGTDHSIVAGDCAGVRQRRLPALLGAADLQR